MLKINYDPEGKTLNISFGKRKITHSNMVENCILDYDKYENTINIEVLEIDPSDIKIVKDGVAK